MTKMRAKARVGAVLPTPGPDGKAVAERLVMHGVAKSTAYPEDGSDEDNTFAKFTPSLTFDIQIANPDLIGKFEVGQTFYVEFSPAD